jgi:hypothetical protein
LHATLARDRQDRLLRLPGHRRSATIQHDEVAIDDRTRRREGDAMRRLSLIVLVVGLLALAVPASAQEPEFEEHPHMLILGLELDAAGEPIGFRKCVDLAANQALVLGSHHENVHFGTAGEMLFTKAGNVVVPGAPFPAPFEEPVPWSNCEELIAFFFGG